MSEHQMSNEEKLFIRALFQEMRKELDGYMTDREFKLSNPQLFTFLTFAPAALAIASDENVDEYEIAVLEKVSKQINVKTMVSLDLLEIMSVAFEPENCIINEEFNLRVGSEILNLSRNMKKYESNFVNAIKVLLKFDTDPKRENSLTKNFSILMDSVIEQNVSKNKEKELEKMKNLKAAMGIV